jgi:hypothetical protein
VKRLHQLSVCDAEILQYAPMITAMARRFYGMYRNRGSIEDLIQTGWVGLLEGLRRIDADKLGERIPWVYLRAWVWGEINRSINPETKRIEPGQLLSMPGRESDQLSVSDFWIYVNGFHPTIAEFVRMLVNEGETPETACNRMGIAHVKPGHMVKIVKDYLVEVFNGCDDKKLPDSRG